MFLNNRSIEYKDGFYHNNFVLPNISGRNVEQEKEPGILHCHLKATHR
jgi:hypothetical protein